MEKKMHNTAHNYATTSRAYREAFNQLVIKGTKDMVLRDGMSSTHQYLPHEIAKSFSKALNRTFPLRAYAQVDEGTTGDSMFLTSCLTNTAWEEEGKNTAVELQPAFSEMTQNVVRPKTLLSVTAASTSMLADQPHLAEKQIIAALGEAMGEKLEAATTQKIIEITDRDITGGMDAESIKKVYFNQPAHQRMSSVWVMNDNTLLTLAGLEVAGAQPLVDMASMTMLGRPIVLSPSMPDAETGSKPVAFLNPKRVRLIESDYPSLLVMDQRWAVQGFKGYLCKMRSQTVIDRPDHVSLLTIQ
ncbi:phage major capsid protein [Leucobacter sp. OH2974_COT-288]|nr:phage major capsid protein [Leucobacter sp. OH2974_COT-288]